MRALGSTKEISKVQCHRDGGICRRMRQKCTSEGSECLRGVRAVLKALRSKVRSPRKCGYSIYFRPVPIFHLPAAQRTSTHDAKADQALTSQECQDRTLPRRLG